MVEPVIAPSTRAASVSDRPRIIAVTNQKGGSGKTTTVVNLASALGERGRRVLVIDLDPQSSTSAWLGHRDGGDLLLRALTQQDSESLSRLLRPSTATNVTVVPSSIALFRAERDLANEVGGDRALALVLSRLPLENFDYVLIDTAPSLGLLTINALQAAGEVLVPVEASSMALAGLVALQETLRKVQDRLNPRLRLAGVFACRVDTRNNVSREVLSILAERFPRHTLQTTLRENVRLREAWSFAQPIQQYDRASTGARDYRSLADEIIDMEAEH